MFGICDSMHEQEEAQATSENTHANGATEAENMKTANTSNLPTSTSASLRGIRSFTDHVRRLNDNKADRTEVEIALKSKADVAQTQSAVARIWSAIEGIKQSSISRDEYQSLQEKFQDLELEFTKNHNRNEDLENTITAQKKCI